MATLFGMLASASLPQIAAAGLAAFVLAIVVDGFAIPQRLRLRHIPGPPPKWLVGHALDAKLKHGMFLFEMWREMGSKYGRVFKWFWGTQPIITIRDPELARLVLVKHWKSFPHRSMFYPPQPRVFGEVLGSGLTFAQGSYWSGSRAALQPLFHASGLESYHRLTARAVSQLEARLAAAAASGAPVDVAAGMCNLALKVVGEAAFGVEFHTMGGDGSGDDAVGNQQQQQQQAKKQQQQDKKQQQQQQRDANNASAAAADASAAASSEEDEIVSAAKYVLENTAKALVFFVTPRLLKPLVWAAVRALPTPTLKGLNEARSVIYSAAVSLTKNAMRRMGAEWRDELGMERAFASAGRGGARTAARYASSVPAPGSVVDHLVAARDRGTGLPLKAHQIIGHVNSIMVAGHDTTSFMLASAVYFLATHPEAARRMAEEADGLGPLGCPLEHSDLHHRFPYAEAALNEALRLHPPGWMTSRECVADADVGGWRVPKGSVVYVDIRGIHRDEAQWGGDAAEFKPERFLDKAACAARHPLAHMPFGAGPRLCIGYKLAMQEAVHCLVRLYQRFEFEVDARMTSVPAPLRPGITLGFRDGLWCRVRERSGRGIAGVAGVGCGKGGGDAVAVVAVA